MDAVVPVVLGLTVMAPFEASALSNCSANLRRRDGVIVVGAGAIDGALGWASAENHDPDVLPALRCTSVGDRATCTLSDPAVVPPPSPPSDCVVRLSDKSSECIAYVKGCVRGDREVVACMKVSGDGREVVYQGCNVHIRNDTGVTAAVDGTGNLIVGWNEDSKDGLDRSGSHVIVVGEQHSWTSAGGIVAGFANTITGVDATVLGGTGNLSEGVASAVLGGRANTASGNRATVSGGSLNTASGSRATVSGGNFGIAQGLDSSIAGGTSGTASGDASFVGGGGGNAATGPHATVVGGSVGEALGHSATVAGGILNFSGGLAGTVVGGERNIAGEFEETVPTVVGGLENVVTGSNGTALGGMENLVSGPYATVTGGEANIAAGPVSAVNGGFENVAEGYLSTIGGGSTRSVSGMFDWAAGALFQDN